MTIILIMTMTMMITMKDDYVTMAMLLLMMMVAAARMLFGRGRRQHFCSSAGLGRVGARDDDDVGNGILFLCPFL